MNKYFCREPPFWQIWEGPFNAYFIIFIFFIFLYYYYFFRQTRTHCRVPDLVTFGLDFDLFYFLQFIYKWSIKRVH